MSDANFHEWDSLSQFYVHAIKEVRSTLFSLHCSSFFLLLHAQKHFMFSLLSATFVERYQMIGICFVPALHTFLLSIVLVYILAFHSSI